MKGIVKDEAHWTTDDPRDNDEQRSDNERDLIAEPTQSLKDEAHSIPVSN
jgi:hypothetical protein